VNTENKSRFIIIPDRNLHSVLFRLQRVSYHVRDLVQFLPSGFVSIIRAKPHTETITRITGKDMQVDVKDFLPRSLAVREADIDPFTLDPTMAQRRGNTLRDAKHMRAFFLAQPCEVWRMSVGNYQRVPGIDGLMVQKS
jgi:hypothetical protein